MRAAREKRGIEWEGMRLSVFPDRTQELAEKRKTFTSVKRSLLRLNKIYAGASSVTEIHMEGEESEFHKRQGGRAVHRGELQYRWVSWNAMSDNTSVEGL